MTTPHQGPGMWQQGDAFEALEWLANLGRPPAAGPAARDEHPSQALSPIMQTAAAGPAECDRDRAAPERGRAGAGQPDPPVRS